MHAQWFVFVQIINFTQFTTDLILFMHCTMVVTVSYLCLLNLVVVMDSEFHYLTGSHPFHMMPPHLMLG